MSTIMSKVCNEAIGMFVRVHQHQQDFSPKASYWSDFHFYHLRLQISF